MSTLTVSLVAMGGLAIFFALFLLFAHTRLSVREDPRVQLLAEGLPNANCGACGYPGCRQYAQALVEGKAEPDRCAPGGQAVRELISRVLGIEVKETAPQVAKVMCRGGAREARKRMEYSGLRSCRALEATVGGHKECIYGCLGQGDCVEACPFDAIHMTENCLPSIDPEKCTACGKCVEVCPRGIIRLVPKDQKVFVFCMNRDKGASARKACSVACIGCTLCVKNAPPDSMKMENNLAVILDYRAVDAAAQQVTAKCPTHAIAAEG